MKRHTPNKYLALELGTQFERLKYGYATVYGKTYCPFPPRKIAIEASSFCNLRCIHCAHGISPDGSERMTRRKNHMSLDLFKHIADDAAKFRNRTKLVFALMGEPLMNKNLPEMISYAHEKGLWTQVNTNSVLLNQKKGRELIDAGLDFIYLSLDGVTQKTYESIRIRGDFNQTLNNILDFVQLKYELNALDLTIHIGMTSEIINRSELDIFVKEFSKLPIDAVYSPLLFNWLSAIEWVESPLNKAQDIPLQEYPVCNSPYDIPGIQSNGDFIPCMYDFDGRYVSGNVGQQSIMDLWNNERTQNFRDAILKRDYNAIEEKGPMCSQCTILWNSHYSIKSHMKDALAQVMRYTMAGIKEYFNTGKRRRHLHKKYIFLREFREQFIQQLELHAKEDPAFSHTYERVVRDGVLEVRL